MKMVARRQNVPAFAPFMLAVAPSFHGTVWMLPKRTLVIAALMLPPAALVLPPAGSPALAQQEYNRPPAGIGDEGRDGDMADTPYRGGGADAGDPGAVAVRVGKLEGRIREMTGQIEELQNANRKLTDQIQKFQADVEFRLQDKGGVRPAKHSEVAAPAGANGPAMDADGLPPPKLAATKTPRGDAFDPAAVPAAPGAPKPLGSAASATPDDAPLDLTGGALRPSTGSSGALAPTLQAPASVTPKAAGGTVTPNGTVIANLAPNSPKEEFDVALGYYKDKQYESAEKGFTAFIEKNPKSRLIADATYYIGETYAQRGRQREAAEQYLKISTDFANSARAPEAMLRLGVSLKALGAKEQACATFTEVTRKYPNAPPYVKTGAEREAKRAQC